MGRNELFLNKARALAPELHTRTVKAPCGAVPLKKGGIVCLDFGAHFVGYVTLRLGSVGSHPDAPVWLRLKFAERESELRENVEDYHGWISASWVQQEQVYVDVLPCTLRLPRRYALRYVQIEVLDISEKYDLMIDDASCEAVSSADDAALTPYETEDTLLQTLDAVAVRTLHDCMQSVFEDGPKRDRRLWIGDLRLQALANYETYRNNDLVKRCLYLFAGSTRPDGRIGACIFLEPEIEVDDTELFDYSLLFVPTLLDYCKASGDEETLRELWPTAMRQIELAKERFDARGLIRDSDTLGWCFVDWDLALNKQASAQAIYIYCARAAAEIAERLGDKETLAALTADIGQKQAAALSYLYDQASGLFVSGKDRQVSWASQIWMVLAGLGDAALLERVETARDAVKPVTPYLYHHYVDALLAAGRREKALAVLTEYWGGMVNEGADTFWELYDPEDPNASPYGGTIVLSYCHAWSCAPAYFLRKYFGK